MKRIVEADRNVISSVGALFVHKPMYATNELLDEKLAINKVPTKKIIAMQ